MMMSNGTDQISPFNRTVVYELTEGVLGQIETITVTISRLAGDVDLSAESENGDPVPATLAEDRQMLVFEDDLPLDLGDQEIVGLSLQDETFSAIQSDIRMMKQSLTDEPETGIQAHT